MKIYDLKRRFVPFGSVVVDLLTIQHFKVLKTKIVIYFKGRGKAPEALTRKRDYNACKAFLDTLG